MKEGILYSLKIEGIYKLQLRSLSLRSRMRGAHLFTSTNTEAFIEEGGLNQVTYQ